MENSVLIKRAENRIKHDKKLLKILKEELDIYNIVSNHPLFSKNKPLTLTQDQLQTPRLTKYGKNEKS